MAVDDVQEIEALAELGIAAGRLQGLHWDKATCHGIKAAGHSRWPEDLQDLFVWKAAASG